MASNGPGNDVHNRSSADLSVISGDIIRPEKSLTVCKDKHLHNRKGGAALRIIS